MFGKPARIPILSPPRDRSLHMRLWETPHTSGEIPNYVAQGVQLLATIKSRLCLLLLEAAPTETSKETPEKTLPPIGRKDDLDGSDEGNVEIRILRREATSLLHLLTQPANKY